MTLTLITDPQEIEEINKKFEDFRRKEYEHCKPLFDYLHNNCSIQRIGFQGTQTSSKISIEELLQNTKEKIQQAQKDPSILEKSFQTTHAFKLGHRPGIIQISDDLGEISSVLNSYRRLKKMVESSHTLTQVYERGFLSDEDTPAYYWDYSTHFNFNIEELNKQQEFEKVSFLQTHLQPLDRAYTLATFTNYLDILGYPNGHDSWDNERLFRANYLCENDSKWLIGNKEQLSRYTNFDSRYKIKGLGNLENELRKNEIIGFRKLEEVIKTLQD
ncbi:MAG: hypothetical protein LAT82_01985 [Nanoarchaeota archaeon]|nr:hypothetical protein [Nanoarchaeota archaeon]